MSQDIIADALNQIMNAKRAKKEEIILKKSSKVLINLFEMMKEEGYIDFEKQGREVLVKIIKINECKAIKPRYYVGVEDIEKYLRRFLPSRKFGVLAISTNKGLIDHDSAVELNIGGSLIAYFY